jgi:hypothetical protein
MFNPQLNLFVPNVYQAELLGYEYITIVGDTKSGPVIFTLKDNKEYIDLSASLLQLKVKLVGNDGNAFKSDLDTKTAIGNNALHTIFNDVILSLNGKRVEGGQTLYPYKSYMGTVFSKHENAQKNQLKFQGWERDETGKMDLEAGSGFVARKKWTEASASKILYGKLDLDFFKQDRLLLPGIDMEIKFEKAKDSFMLQCFNDTIKPSVLIEEAKMQLKIVKVNPTVMAQHAHNLQRNMPALYPINRVVIEHKGLKTGDKEFIFDHLFHGSIPKYMILTLLSHG